MSEESRYIEPEAVIHYDASTGERANRGVAFDSPTDLRMRAESRELRGADWEEYCFRVNVLIHGYDKAKTMIDSLRNADAEFWANVTEQGTARALEIERANAVAAGSGEYFNDENAQQQFRYL